MVLLHNLVGSAAVLQSSVMIRATSWIVLVRETTRSLLVSPGQDQELKMIQQPGRR